MKKKSLEYSGAEYLDSDDDSISVECSDSDSESEVDSAAAVQHRMEKKLVCLPEAEDSKGMVNAKTHNHLNHALDCSDRKKDAKDYSETVNRDSDIEADDDGDKDAIDLQTLGKNRRSIVSALNKFKDEVPDEYYAKKVDNNDGADDNNDNEIVRKTKRGTVCYLDEWQGKLNNGVLDHTLDKNKRESAEKIIKSFLDKLEKFIKRHNLVALTKGRLDSSYKSEIKKFLSYFYIIKCLNKLPENIDKPYFDFDEYTKWLGNRDLKDGSKWFIDIDIIKQYYTDIIPIARLSLQTLLVFAIHCNI